MNKNDQETVSAVIPTRNRPCLVTRAVRSALEQTVSPLEVIVVIDGPDESTVEALDLIEDPRLKTVVLSTNRGPAGARNAGVDRAQGQWIAFLDDDDEWLPRKLEVQLEAAGRSRYASPIVTSSFYARTPRGEFVWPRRAPSPSEPLSEYLLARNTLFVGEGDIMASLLLTKRELLRRVPFKSELRLHEDWDWLLRADRLGDVGLEFVREPLVARYVQEDRENLSEGPGYEWRRSLTWIRDNQHLVTPRGYAGFIATIVSPAAARQGEWRAFFPLLREILKPGRPKPMDLLLFAGMWLVPQEVRRQLRALLVKTRGT